MRQECQSWFQLPSGNWELATLLSSNGTEFVVSLAGENVLKVHPDSLIPANPTILDGVDDLIQLSYLNEPSVLHNLKYRYNQNMIYTKAGPVLVAVNPFKEIPLYGDDFIEAYKQKSIEQPHVYAIADMALKELIRDEISQSIIISGESGSGKTETAKIAMQYLAALGGGSGIEHEILKTNPILEAFGNAKTSRNDNSSRFGKLIEIQFSQTAKISGAKIQAFLLEKCRVVQCAKGERSYHIFYQLCAGAPPFLKEKLNLKSAHEYKYLQQSDCYTISDVNDAKSFQTVLEALNVVHVTQDDQESVFAMLAAVLWFGNISFTMIDNENHVEAVLDEGLFTVANLIGCDVDVLNLALSSRKMTVGTENIIQKLTYSQAIEARDSLAKSIYACLFEWLVGQINKSFSAAKRQTGRSISILDIYGFESFASNSFEQFCINYANERLQQLFNRHLFKLEQEEYVRDGIDWTKVDFEDNQECLELFEKKPVGLLSLLDEESTFPNATDLTFVNKLEKHLESRSCFLPDRGKAFGVHHYAGEVIYNATGFLEKNRDLLHVDSIQLLSSCRGRLPKIFASNMVAQPRKSNTSGGIDAQKSSVATKFKDQLFVLMQRLENTTPHFIRCVKPNSQQSPGLYDQKLVLQQLRCCGVLEVVRISRSGFPTRISHQKFAKRYGFLLLESIASQDPLSVSVAILRQFGILPEMYHVGYTKLFLRTGQIGMLEDKRNQILRGILRIQSCYRGFRARLLCRDLMNGILFIQSIVRREKDRETFKILLLQRRAAIIIQNKMKVNISQKEFKRNRQAVLFIQSVIRGWLVRKCSAYCPQQVTTKRCEMKDGERLGMRGMAELQRRVMEAEESLRRKEEENEMLRQRLHKYELHWSEYERKMKSMDETWKMQMSSLEASVSIAKRSLEMGDFEDGDDGSDESRHRRFSGYHIPVVDERGEAERLRGRDGNGFRRSTVRRMSEEFEKRKQVFGDDIKFMVEVKSGEVDAKLEPERELQKLKQTFELWKKDFGGRLRETKLILNKLEEVKGGGGSRRRSSSSSGDKGRKSWWERLNSSRMSFSIQN